MPGRRKRPTALEERMGNPRKQRKNPAEPKPKLITGTVHPPDWLDDEAAGEWYRIAPKLAGLGLLTELDIPALATFCQSYSDFARLTKELADGRSTYEICDEEGNLVQVKVRPEWYLRRTAFLQLIRVATEFGMTPSSRGRMVVEASPLTPREELLKALDGDIDTAATVQ